MRGTFRAIAGASALLLIGCGQGGNRSASAGNAPTTNNSASADMAGTDVTAAAPAAVPPSGAPAEAYRRYFDERWGRGGAAVTPAEVASMLRKQTPQQTVNALYGNGEKSRWDTLASGIARGDPAWLTLAPQIAQGTDAGTAVDFAVAVQDALTTNPAGALRLLTQVEMGVGACAENGMEVPAEQARIYFRTATAAVESVSDPALQQIKTQCLAELRKGAASYPGA